jgi:hypothetical protein
MAIDHRLRIGTFPKIAMPHFGSGLRLFKYGGGTRNGHHQKFTIIRDPQSPESPLAILKRRFLNPAETPDGKS